MGHKRATPQLAPLKITESIAINIMRKVWLIIVRTLRTWTDKLFKAMEIKFGNLIDDSRSREY